MSVNGELELVLDEEKSLGFLSFKISELGDLGDMYRVSARIVNDEDKKKYKKWKCATVLQYICANCDSGSVSSLERAVLTSDAPSFDFMHMWGRFCSCLGRPSIEKFMLSLFLDEETNGLQYQSKKTRFTDEAEAKELNANCKISFEDSGEPVFVNRSFLTMYSKVFRVMFEGDFKEKDAEEVKLGVKREDFLSFLDCLYFPPAPLTVENFKAVVTIADRYDCPQLLEKCKEFAKMNSKDRVTVEECMDYVEVAEHLGWEDVLTIIITSLKSKNVKFFMDLLDGDWIVERKENTRRAFFAELKVKVSPLMN